MMSRHPVKVQGFGYAQWHRAFRGQPPSRARTRKSLRPPQGKEGYCLPRQGRKPQVFAPKERATGAWGAFATPQRALGTFGRSKVPPRAAVTENCIVRKVSISVASMVRKAHSLNPTFHRRHFCGSVICTFGACDSRAEPVPPRAPSGLPAGIRRSVKPPRGRGTRDFAPAGAGRGLSAESAVPLGIPESLNIEAWQG